MSRRLLPTALLTLLLAACAPWKGRTASDSSAVKAADPADSILAQIHPADPASLERGAGLPFPEAKDSVRFDVPVSDTVRAFFRTPADSAFARPADTAGRPVLGRPDFARTEGIRIKPRPKDLPAYVRVLITKSSKPLPLYSLGEVEIRNDAPGGSKPVTARGRLSIKRNGGDFEVAQNGKTFLRVTARRLRLVSLNPYNLLELGGNVYRGHFEVIAAPTGELSAVNVVGVEDYLRGVLPYELGTVDRSALEALKSMAVAARTYAFKRMLNNPNGDFHVYSDVQDQVYKGVRSEYLLSDRAIRETRGMALVIRDSLVHCYYHSTCGGRTAMRHELWGGDSTAYLISRPDTDPAGTAWCQSSKYSEWKQEWTLPQLAGILKRNLKSANVPDYPEFSKLVRIEIPTRAACGRVRTLRLVTDRGDITVKGDKVRWALRPAGAEERILPSAWFDAKVTDGKAIVQGKGFGHGIGLCQVGSIARAKAGQDFRKIMLSYYTGAELVEFRP
jgi:stage II sporulation protein D